MLAEISLPLQKITTKYIPIMHIVLQFITMGCKMDTNIPCITQGDLSLDSNIGRKSCNRATSLFFQNFTDHFYQIGAVYRINNSQIILSDLTKASKKLLDQLSNTQSIYT